MLVSMRNVIVGVVVIIQRVFTIASVYANTFDRIRMHQYSIKVRNHRQYLLEGQCVLTNVSWLGLLETTDSLSASYLKLPIEQAGRA